MHASTENAILMIISSNNSAGIRTRNELYIQRQYGDHDPFVKIETFYRVTTFIHIQDGGQIKNPRHY